MKTVQVTGGEITLRERADLRVRDRQFLQEHLLDAQPVLEKLPYDEHGNLDEERALEGGLLTREAITALYDLTKAAIVVRIASWTLEGEPPRTIEQVDDLNASLYDELQAEVSEGLQELIGDVDFDPSNPAAPGAQERPTSPSAA